jgi:Fe-coproporphyrin III synthase
MIGMIFPMVDFGIKTKIMGRKIPLLASFKLTYRCNLKCPGCPFHARCSEPGSHLSWPQAVAAMDRLQEMGCRFVIFEGGEPLLWKDGERSFKDIATEASKRFLRTGVVTNGTLPLNAKTDILWISLDGPADAHNDLRCNSWDTIMRNLESSEHRRIYAHCTVNRANAARLEDLAAAVSAISRIRGITFQFFYPYNRGERELSLTGEEREMAVRTILGIRGRAEVRVLNSRGTLKRMVKNNWKCREWLLANVHPDGTVSTGCYVRGRGEVRCDLCGFTPVAEASRSFGLHPGALLSGIRIFG